MVIFSVSPQQAFARAFPSRGARFDPTGGTGRARPISAADIFKITPTTLGGGAAAGLDVARQRDTGAGARG